MNPLRILDPKRSLTPRMWAILGFSFAAWLFWFCVDFRVLHGGHKTGRSLGQPSMLLPYLIIVLASPAVEDKLQPLPERNSTRDLAMLLGLIAVGVALALYLAPRVSVSDPAWFWLWTGLGLWFIFIRSRQWSKRAFTLKAKAAPVNVNLVTG